MLLPILALFLGFVLFIYHGRQPRKGVGLPGPPGVPIIGNVLQIPKDRQWLKWAEWKEKYGDVYRISIFGTPTIILSSFQAATDLLETRGNIYSDRPTATMAGELVGWSRGLGYAQASNNPRFRELRRLFHQLMGPRACADDNLLNIQERENKSLLRKLLTDPENFDAHARECTSSLILALTYGYPSNTGDPLGLIKITEDAMHGFAVASEPGKWWVDSVPALKYIPSWFPGGSFQRAAQAMRADLNKLFEIPYQFVKKEITAGRPNPSFLLDHLEEKNGHETAEEEELVQAFGAALYSGGAETTPSALTSFILAMALNPQIRFYHPGLPTFKDRDEGKLLYVSALVKEVWRWNPSVPLGLPHVASEDDEYRGYTIEKGSVVWANVWAILHDPAVFSSPHKFQPDRYLGAASEQANSVVASAFGFGRRICPGMHIASNSVFIAIATILTLFRIEKYVDGEGRVVEPVEEYDGFISHPRAFKCRIEPRFEGIESLLTSEFE
ncbi:cytochrome P450 [Roridomyces roridus]|uniref:Cytochrome P450 n=1 Tax=Roridomyces roridus TaxID=1738132 RepID=A0AAD7FTE3_9AGAR|nr:cytochrome P450 [Roridomyces roridus]